MDAKTLFYIIITTILLVTSVETCKMASLQETPCITTLICNNRIEWPPNYYSSYGSHRDLDRNCIDILYYQGNNIYPLKVIFRDELKNGLNMGIDYGYGNIVCNFIYYLDISNNNYEDFPRIPPMSVLKSLNISRNHLTIAKLSSVNQLQMLTKLDLSYNNINKIQINVHEYRLSKLTEINLSHNYLVEIPNAIFDDFDDLQTIDISNNFLDALSPLIFEGVKNLVNLNLSNNRLTNINSSLFRFVGLKILNLSGNRLKEFKFSDIEQLVSLKSLDLSSNVIISFNENTFSTMVLLNTLDLSNNELNTIKGNSFSNLCSLKKINLSKNKIKSIPLGLFKNTTVVELLVNENMLEGSLLQGMFDGVSAKELDLSNQFLKLVGDFAFYELISLEILLLNSNSIEKISRNSFKTLCNLTELDLSHNQIVVIEFNTEDLYNLHSLILKSNRIAAINHDQLSNLTNLEYLDISNNLITRLEPSLFMFFRNMINLKINSNPLVGALETGTFDGLLLLPTLDISNNMLDVVRNFSFSGMTTLKDLNMTTCKIKEIEYNAFTNTGYIETLDLSYNQLKYFCLNMTDLIGLSTLLLNNNQITNIAEASFNKLSLLNKLLLSHNAIENIDIKAFDDLVDLRYLDLSYNSKINVTWKVIENKENLQTLILSGVKSEITFKDIKNVITVVEFFMSNASVESISNVGLNKMAHLTTLCLSSNNVTKLQGDDFSGLKSLLVLDLSFNKISYIQPSVFKENSVLTSLNMSHNYITSISYGILRGLVYLNILDVSHNRIKDLETERFYEVQSLAELIVDYNEIESINGEEFIGSSLRKLSIGNNPLACQTLVKLKQRGVPFVITAIEIDEHSNENIDGISCNNNHTRINEEIVNEKVGYNENILNDLKRILLSLPNKTIQKDDKDIQYLEKMIKSLNTSNFIYNEKLSSLINLTSNLNNNTFTLLSNIINLINRTSDVSKPTLKTSIPTISTIPTTTTLRTINNLPLPKNDINLNNTVNIISYINKIKEELQNTIMMEKHNIIDEIETKIASKYKTDLPSTIGHEKLVSNNKVVESNFTEICVGLILFISVALVLYKFYKSRIYIRNRLSISTRELHGAMENSAL